MEKCFVAAACLLLLLGCSRESIVSDAEPVSPQGRESVPDDSPAPPVAVEKAEAKGKAALAPPSIAVSTVDEAVRIGALASEQLVAAFSGHPDALEIKARFEFEFGSPDAAALLWRQILEVSPEYTYALAGLGDYEHDRGNLDEAAGFYRRAAETAPGAPSQKVTLASCLSEVGRLDEAKELLEEVRESHPLHGEACNELGAVLLQQREYKRARDVYREAVGLDPTDPKAHSGLATAAIRLGDRELAGKHLELHRKYRHQRRASLADERRKYDDSAAISTDIAELLSNIAMVYISQERADVAAKFLEQAVVLSESHLPSRKLLARLAKQQGDLEKALHWQQQVARLSPSDLQATVEQAMLLGAAGRIDEAEQAVESFVEENPDDAEATMTLAQFYVGVKPELEKAIGLAERGAQLSGKADDLIFLAALQEHVGDKKRAAETVETAASLPASDAKRQHQLLEALLSKLRSNPRLAN